MPNPNQSELPHNHSDESVDGLDNNAILELLDNLVCDVCLESNLTEDIHVQECVSCGENYCRHHSSVVDGAYCSKCLHDVSVTIETIRKVELHEASDGVITEVKPRKARQIKIGGMHWLFIQRKIKDLTDVELELAIEYHHALYSSMIYEREKKRLEGFHRNAGKSFKVPTTATTATTTTEIKKTRKIKSTTPQTAEVNAQQVFAKLIAQGFSPEMLMKMALGKK